jgi:hypothetical protein
MHARGRTRQTKQGAAEAAGSNALGLSSMVFRVLCCLAAFLLFTSCTGSRGGFVDKALTDTLYEADTKAERLLRYFEVQALLVRFVSESGGSIDGRNAVALANAAATVQLNSLVGCLRSGSVTGNAPLATLVAANKIAAASDPVRVDTTYCSFFESRLIAYEEALLSMVRQAARDDPDAKLLENALTGPNVLSFASVVSTLVDLAGRAIRDEMILRAFTADALELEELVWQSDLSGPSQLYANCPAGLAACNDTNVAMPERASIDALRSQILARNASAAAGERPTILVWHFQEVEAYLVAACQALNGDAVDIKGLQIPKCSGKLPFPLPTNPQSGGGRPPVRQVVLVPPVAPAPTVVHPTDAELTANCGQIDKDRKNIAALTIAGDAVNTKQLIDKANADIARLTALNQGKSCS